MDVPELVGHTYAEALQAFQESSVIGCLTAAGLVELNPPPAYVFGAGDEIVVISEDDSSVDLRRVRRRAGPCAGGRRGAG